MAKQLFQEPIQAADLREYLDSSDDFAFEREVYHVAKSLGLQAEHAALYEDPVTNKQRQFDIRASKELRSLFRKIYLTIECKSLSTAYPLLVSCVPRAADESFHEVLTREEGGRTTSRRSQGPENGVPRYRVGQGVGKSMRQVGRLIDRNNTKGELTVGDDVFDKWTQALASAADSVNDGAQLITRNKTHLVAILPVLVVPNNTLWVANYSSDGSLQEDPFLVEEIPFYVGRKYEVKDWLGHSVTLTVSHLEVHTQNSIGSLLSNIASSNGGIWQELFAQ